MAASSLPACQPPEADLFDIAGRCFIVTGAGHGLGREMATELARRGATIVVAARTAKEIEETAETITQAGGNAIPIAFDAMASSSCDALIDDAFRNLGKVDGLVLNHGLGHGRQIVDLDDAEFDRVIQVNLNGCLYCARALGKRWIASGTPGSIVLVSSTAAISTFDNLIAYGTSKAAATQLCRQLAVEWGQYGIRANAIAPGYMTHMMKGTADRYTGASVDDWVEKMTPLRRRGDPRELLGAIIYFLSDAASFTTGQVLAIDGGYTTV